MRRRSTALHRSSAWPRCKPLRGRARSFKATAAVEATRIGRSSLARVLPAGDAPVDLGRAPELAEDLPADARDQAIT